MERFQGLQFWSILGPNLLPENQNHCYRPTSLGISNNVSLRSQKNHIILVKLSNVIFREGGGVQWVIKCPLVSLLNAIINSHLAYNANIRLDAKF